MATEAQAPTIATEAVSRSAKLWLLAIGAAVLLLRLSLLSAPTLRDEGLYGYGAQEVLRGYLPLETAMDNKGPVLFYEWALALWAFGLSSIEGIRLLGTLFVLGTLGVLFMLARDMRGERFALIAVGLLAFHTSLAEMDGYYYATEFYTLLPSTLSAALAWRAARSTTAWPAFFSGIFLGLSIWTRLTTLTLAPWLGLFLLIVAQKNHKVARALALTAGVGVVSGLFLALYASQGKLQILTDAWVAFPAVQVVTADAFISEADQLWSVARVFAPQAVLLWLPLLASLRPSAIRGTEGKFVWSWLVVAFAGFWMTHLYFPKQLFLVFPPLCLIAAAQLELWSRSHRKALLALVSACVAFNVAWNAPKHSGLMRGDPSASDHIITQGEKVSAWIKANTKPEDYIYNWGVEWELYFRSERRSPTRQVNALVFVMLGVAVERGAPVGDVFERLQREVIGGLEAHPPEIVALTAGTQNYDMKSLHLPGYVEIMLRDKYDLLFREDPYWVFRRKAQGSPEND